MRKKVFIVFTLTLCVIFMAGMIFPLGSLSAKTAYFNEYFPNVRNKERLASIIILPEDRDVWGQARPIIERLDSLPAGLLDALSKNRVKMKLFTGLLTDNREAKHLKGLIPRGYQSKTWDDVPGMGGSKTVLVRIGHSDNGQGHSSVNLELHELGHTVDKQLLQVCSQTIVFQQIWMKEVGNLFPNQDYFIQYPEEYFAECFALFHFNQETKQYLMDSAPDTFSFFQELDFH